MLVTMRPWMPRRRLALATEICGCGFSGCKLDVVRDRYLRLSADPDADALANVAYHVYCAETRACDERYEHNRTMRLALQSTARTRAKFAQAMALGMAQVYSNKQCGAPMLCMRGAR